MSADAHDDWPTWATAPVELVASDPTWPGLAARLADELDGLLAPWLAAPVEHVGSTAVPDLVAKPVIDLLAPVSDLGGAPHAADVLADAGWHLVPPDLDARPWRRLHVLPDGDVRRAHLHLVAHDHPRAERMRTFRDVLRRRPDLRDEYARVKTRAAAEHRDDREAYTRAKADVVRRVLADPGQG